MLDLLDPSLLAHAFSLAADTPAPAPEDKDVKAGYTALLIFLAMCVAVGLLGWSLTRHLRKTRDNRDAGVYGDPTVDPDGAQQPGDLPGDQR